jgi:oligogalacturonide lyase
MKHLIPPRVSLIAMFVVLSRLALAQPAQPPKTWVDRDTGHRVYRLSDEPGSSAFYFSVNAYSPDERFMIYTAPDGIHTLEMSTRKTRLLVPNPPLTAQQPHQGNHAVVVGHKTDSIFFTTPDSDAKTTTVYKADMNTGVVTKLATLPPRASIATINADETLGAGVYDETETGAQQEYGPSGRPRAPDTERAPLVQPESKGAMMERRLAARIPVML